MEAKFVPAEPVEQMVTLTMTKTEARRLRGFLAWDETIPKAIQERSGGRLSFVLVQAFIHSISRSLDALGIIGKDLDS